VVSLNLQRRHLSDSERSFIAARIANRAQGRPQKNVPNGTFSTHTEVSRQEAADMLNTSRRSTQRAPLKGLSFPTPTPASLASRLGNRPEDGLTQLDAAAMKGGVADGDRNDHPDRCQAKRRSG
jgi:hypothetical protein